jgi:hypothetical protein
MSAVEHVAYVPSPYMRIGTNRRKVTALRAADWQLSEDQQKRRVREARARIEAPRPKPLLLPVPTIAEPLKPHPQPISFSTAPTGSIPSAITNALIAEILAKHGVAYVEMMSKSRTRRIAIARAEICYELRRQTHMSLPQIGRKVGGKDHSTVTNAIQRHAFLNDLPELSSTYYDKKITWEFELSFLTLWALRLSYGTIATLMEVGRPKAVAIIRHWRERNE